LLGWAYALQRNWPATLRHLQRADACWQASGNKGRRAMTLNNLGTVAMEQGRYTEARAAFETGLTLAHETGRRREEATLRRSMADLDLYEGQFSHALIHFREAYALAARLDLLDDMAIAAVGALWAAVLAGTSAEAETWQQIVAEHAVSDLPEVRGRKALALSLLLLRQPRPDGALLAKHLAEAMAVDDAMLAADRAYLALLRAAQIFERTGWAEAAAVWEGFEHRAAGLSEALLMHFVPPHRRLFEVAAQTSSLAQRLMSARQDNRLRRWQITALGNFACLVDGVACDLSPLHRALLVRLLDAGQKGLSVEQAWEAIWGENDISMAAIHQALYRLRTQTGLAAAARDGMCAIQSAWDMIEYDVRALEKILDGPISSESIQQARALYQGDFLLSVPPSAALWADARRTYLRQHYLDILEAYAQSIEDTVPSQAIQYYQQILQIDGCREQTAVLLMHVAARSGNYSLVTETFEQLKGSLRVLGTTPEPATIAFLQATVR
jgi:DNA-binding SARP family transcriptional activator